MIVVHAYIEVDDEDLLCFNKTLPIEQLIKDITEQEKHCKTISYKEDLDNFVEKLKAIFEKLNNMQNKSQEISEEYKKLLKDIR